MTTSTNGPATLSDRVRSLRLNTNGGSRRSLFPWVLCGVLALTTAAFAFRAFGPPRDDGPKAGAAPSVNDQAAGSGDVVLEAKGYVIAPNQMMISPLVSGQVLELNFQEGDRVRKGTVLAKLDPRDYQAEFDRAEAQWKDAQAARKRAEQMQQSVWDAEKKKVEAELRGARSSLVLRKLELDREKDLAGKGGGLTTREKLDAAEAAHQTAVQTVAAAEANLLVTESTPRGFETEAALAREKQALAEVEKARLRLSYCTVLAPTDGTILTKKASVYNFVNPIAFNVSASLCEMADLSDLEIDLSIQERDIANVVKGQKCALMPEAFQNNKEFRTRHPNGYEGVVSRLMPIADRAKGAIPVRVKVSNVPRDEEGVYLKPDMSVIVSFKKMEAAAAEGSKPIGGKRGE